MNKTIKALFLTGYGMLSFNSFAQTDTAIRGTVVVRMNYKPEILQGEKFFSTPLPETAYIAPPVISFKDMSAQGNLSLKPNLPAIKAMALPNPKLSRLYGNFVKLGIGNYAAPFMEVSLMNLRSKEITAGINLHHFSNNGNSLDRKWSENNADAYLTKYFSKYLIHLGATYDRDARKFYAYEKSIGDSSDSKSLNIHQQYILLNGGIKSYNRLSKPDATNYSADLSYSNLTNQYQFTEQNFTISGTYNKMVQGNPLKVKSELDANNFEGLYTYKRIFFKVNPTYKLVSKSFTTEFGLRAIYLHSDNLTVSSNKYYFYPDLKAEYKMENMPIYIHAGFTGDNNKSTWKSLYTENPFLSKQIRLGNQISNKIYYGGSMQIDHWNFEAKGYYYFKSTLPIYYFTYQNPFMTDSFGSYSVLYQALNYQQYQFNVSYSQNNKWYFNLSGNIYRYESKQKNIGLMYPSADLKMHLQYQMDEKFYFKLDAFAQTKRQVGFADSSFTNFKPIMNVKGYVDINLSCDYRYSKHVSAFIAFRNLTNSAYARWYNYPVNRINFLTGVTITL